MRKNYSGLMIALSLLATPAFAWGPDGHHTVGQLASELIKGSHAATRVKSILGTVTLADAAVWADCAKGVNEQHNFKYEAAGKYPECKVFETRAGKKAMIAFVRRNTSNCFIKPGEETCHKQYHYTDIDVQQGRYAANLAGARNDDVVQAIGAALAVLQGRSAPAPFNIQGKREALLLLTHYVGDLHQPLHVGAIYLDALGHPVHPDQSGLDPATSTRGGNQLMLADENLHHHWDSIPQTLFMSHVNSAWLTEARALPATPGHADTWAAAWASDTIVQARAAFAGLTFGAHTGQTWPATLPADYDAHMNDIKKAQLTAAGAHLSELLRALWP